jgi:hypothetical protein
MTDLAFCILLIFSCAFVAAVILGKASKDEPLRKEPPIELDEYETFWIKDKV